MKKVFLLLAASSIGMSLNAQESKSVVFLQQAKSAMPINMENHVVTNRIDRSFLMNRSTAQKGTTIHATNNSTWFDYFDQNAVTGYTLYYNTVTPDSNMKDIPATGSPYYVFCHGLGVSFDPTDDKYYGNANTLPITASPITNSTAYIVDSFDVPFKYYRNSSSSAPDSIVIEFAVTSSATDSGTFKLNFPSDPANLPITSDSTPRFADCIYRGVSSSIGPNEVWDSIRYIRQRYAYSISNADTGNNQSMHFALGVPLNVPARAKVVSFVHFKSATPYTLGTSTSANSNFLHLYSGTPEATSGTWPKQTPHSTGYPGSYQTGLIAENDVRYKDPGFSFSGHNILVPGVAYTDPGWSVCYQSFHVKWTSMDEDAVANVNQTINNTSAFPNPAANNLTVAFSLSNSANVTVTLTNAVGQEVAAQTLTNVASGNATFNTAAIASGIYFYTVISNGERSTGRVAIAH